MFSGEWTPLIAAVPGAGHEKGKQMVSVFLHASPRWPTAEAFGGQGSGSGVLRDLTVLQSGMMKERINQSLMKTATTKEKAPQKQ